MLPEKLLEEHFSCLLLLGAHLQLLLKILPWSVGLGSNGVCVILQETDWLTANLTIRLLQLWQASQVDSTLSVLVVKDCV